MRGRLDLGTHKLAGLYRPQQRKRMPKMPGGTRGAYWMIWRIVDGAVSDCFARHPEYLTPAGQRTAQLSITKRVTGALNGYATQVAECRSVQLKGPTADAAAKGPVQSVGIGGHMMVALDTIVGAVLSRMRLWRQIVGLPPKIQEREE